jgi:phosphotransferase system HPr-like phosphotransfer protein
VTTGGRYSAASLIDVLRANLDFGATATLEAHGVDAEEAVERLQTLLGELQRFDES